MYISFPFFIKIIGELFLYFYSNLTTNKLCKPLVKIFLLLCIIYFADIHYALSQSKLNSSKLQNTSSSNNLDSAFKYYEEGYYYYLHGNFLSAEENFSKAIKLEPNFIKAHYWIGKLYQEQGKIKEALFHFEEVNRIKKLIQDRRKALSVQDNDYNVDLKLKTLIDKKRKAELEFILYENSIKEGFWDAALVHIRNAVELYPANINYLLALARIYNDLSMLDSSSNIYKRIINIITTCNQDEIVKQEDILLESFTNLVNNGHIEDVKGSLKKVLYLFDLDSKIQTFASKLLERENKKPLKEFISLEEDKIPKIIQVKNGLVVINVGFEDGLKLNDEYKLRLLVIRPSFFTPTNMKDSKYTTSSTYKIISSSYENVSNSNNFYNNFANKKIVGEIIITKVFTNSSWAIIKREFNKIKEGDLIDFKIN